MSSATLSKIDNADALIAEALVSSGFKWKPAYSPTFEGQLDINGITFKLQISNIDPSFQYLPVVELLERPTELNNTVPHVFSGGKLCYLERLGIFLDPLEPGRTILVIIEAIKRLLNSLLDPQVTQNDFGNEIWAYWNAKDFCYLTTNQRTSLTSIFKRRDLTGNTQLEYVIGDNEKGLAAWRNKRNETSGDHQSLGKAIILDLDSTPKVDLSKDWPPANWNQFIIWLYEKHPVIEQKLLTDLQRLLMSTKIIVVIINSKVSGPIGVCVNFHPLVKKISSRISKKKPNKVKRKQNKSMADFRQRIRSQKLVQDFARLHVVDATPEFIFERNLLTKSLVDTKIAIIGCGTVGSFTSKLLTMAGAGSGNEGVLKLYDGDCLSSANIGRHLLDIEYLGENKSKALAHSLSNSSINLPNIEGVGRFNVNELKSLSDYDLIIDATGDETVSTLISFEFHKIINMGLDFPTIIHAWLDANGYVLRALVDDASGACYRCLKEPVIGSKSGEIRQRYPLFKNEGEETVPAIKHRCGESFIPFAAGASYRISGMIQEMTLDVVHGTPSPRFRHQSLSENIRSTKNQNPSRRENCPCCNQ